MSEHIFRTTSVSLYAAHTLSFKEVSACILAFYVTVRKIRRTFLKLVKIFQQIHTHTHTKEPEPDFHILIPTKCSYQVPINPTGLTLFVRCSQSKTDIVVQTVFARVERTYHIILQLVSFVQRSTKRVNLFSKSHGTPAHVETSITCCNLHDLFLLWLPHIVA